MRTERLFERHIPLIHAWKFELWVESKDGEGWEQTPAHRFRHSESYVRGIASEAGLDVIEIMPCVLRYESNVPVAGMTVALKKTRMANGE